MNLGFTESFERQKMTASNNDFFLSEHLLGNKTTSVYHPDTSEDTKKLIF